MTPKERLHKLVDQLSEAEADVALDFIASRHTSADVTGDIIDEWGNLSKLHRVAFGETMRRLAAEERAAGHEPW